MNGTFRLSIVVAALAAIFGFYQYWTIYSEARRSKYELVRTLECGARLSEMTLGRATNQATGLIDLGKVECADRPFWASPSELEQARTGAIRREWLTETFDNGYAASYAFAYAILAMLVVNLLGLALVTLRATFRWIAAGYKSAP